MTVQRERPVSKKIFHINLNGEKVECISIGRGSELCFIIGPGSFYLSSIISSSDIGEEYTFITSDKHWTDSYSHHDTNLSHDELIDFNHAVIHELKRRFCVNKIGILGISAPGCLALEYTNTFPEDISWLQLISTSFEALDSSFTSSDKLFKEKATPERIQKYENAQKLKFLIEQGENFNETYFTEQDYDIDHGGKLVLKSNSAWILNTISQYHKAFFHDKIRYYLSLINHWEKNLSGQMINDSFRDHFFQNIFPKIDSLKTVKLLEKKSIPIQIFYGMEDFITPISEKILNELDVLQHVKLVKYKECGHYVYLENSKQFYSDFLSCTKSINKIRN